MFEVRWRWDAGIALALPRFRGGKKIPPQIARMNAEDLLASVFPDQVACAENLPGEIEIPDHPLVRQTIRDCLEDAMDIDAFEAVLRRLESGDIRVVARDLTEPSPLALEALNARPYAYLDDAPLEERRTQAVMSRRWIDPADAADIGKLDPEAIARVRAEAWPDATTPDELHDALLWLTFMTGEDASSQPAWPRLMEELSSQNRVRRISWREGVILWVAAERRGLFEPAPSNGGSTVGGAVPGVGAMLGGGVAPRDGAVPLDGTAPLDRTLTSDGMVPSDDAMVAIVRGGWRGWDPLRRRLSRGAWPCRVSRISIALAALELKVLRCAPLLGQCGRRRGVVRAPLAGAHSSLHREAAASGDRAGPRPRVHPLSVRVAARVAGGAYAGVRCADGRADPARGFRSTGRGVGGPKFCRSGLPSTNLSGSMSIAVRDDSSGPGWLLAPRRPRPPKPATRNAAEGYRRSGPRQSPCSPGAMCRCGRRWPAGPMQCPCHREPQRSPILSGNTEHRFSMRLRSTSACCRSRLKRRWQNWWRSAW